jgi:hypothetical protein
MAKPLAILYAPNMSSTSKQPKEEHNNNKIWNIKGTTEISVASYRDYI